MLADWACRRGFASFTAEAGQHEASTSVDRLRAVIWTALAAAGLLDADAPQVTGARRLLSESSEGVPRRLEVRYRHGIAPGNGFRMRPGWRNFDRVVEGDVLAEDRDGEIPAPESGLLFLPLYQELGSDGFFLVRADDTDEERDDET
jgi:succinylglutamate desuccinylase